MTNFAAQTVPANIEWVELTLRVDATITVGTYGGQGTDWMKPGTEMKSHMPGMPNVEQTNAAYQYMYAAINQSLGQVIAALQQQLIERQG